jgi:hypothetical protein
VSFYCFFAFLGHKNLNAHHKFRFWVSVFLKNAGSNSVRGNVNCDVSLSFRQRDFEKCGVGFCLIHCINSLKSNHRSSSVLVSYNP